MFIKLKHNFELVTQAFPKKMNSRFTSSKNYEKSHIQATDSIQ